MPDQDHGEDDQDHDGDDEHDNDDDQDQVGCDHDHDRDDDLRSHLSPSSFAFSNKFLKGDESIVVLKVDPVKKQESTTRETFWVTVARKQEN